MIFRTLLALSLFAALLGPTSLRAEEEVVAKVNGSAITKAEFDRNLDAFLRQRGIPPGHGDKGGKVDELRGQLLNMLIDQELLYQEAVRTGHKIDKEQVEEEIKKVSASFPSQETFEEALAKGGLTVEAYEFFLEKKLSVQEFVQNDIAGKVTVADEEVGQFYKENADKFLVPEQVRARHILLKLEKDADDAAKEEGRKKMEVIIKEAREGADFAELAKKHSQGPSGPNGGDLGLFARGRMVPPFEEAAFALKAGEISDPVLTQFGWHAIKVEERQENRTVPLEEASEQIRNFLTENKVNEAVVARLQSLREKAEIEKLL